MNIRTQEVHRKAPVSAFVCPIALGALAATAGLAALEFVNVVNISTDDLKWMGIISFAAWAASFIRMSFISHQLARQLERAPG